MKNRFYVRFDVVDSEGTPWIVADRYKDFVVDSFTTRKDARAFAKACNNSQIYNPQPVPTVQPEAFDA